MASGYALTNFPNGISSFGIPVFGGSIPPFTGQYLFVDYVNGSDGNDGSPGTPMKTLAAAYAKTTSGNNAVIFIVGDGSTTATQRMSATLTWANNATHLIGLTAPSLFGQRARISNLTTATAEINPMLTVSGSGCIFANFSLFQGVGEASAAEQLVTITGKRNSFSRVQFGGMGATASSGGAAAATSYCINFGSGGEENTFEDCTIGLDTISRTAANASVKFTAGAGAARNVFRRCIFPLYTTSSTPYYVDASGVGSTDRQNIFQDSYFYNAINSGSSVLAAAVNPPVGGGTLVFDNCRSVGVTAWSGASAYVYVTTPTGPTSGVGGIGSHY